MLKGLWGSTVMDTMPSFLRAPSWQQQPGAPQQEQPPAHKKRRGQQKAPAAVVAADAAAWEAAAAAAQQAQQQAAQAAQAEAARLAAQQQAQPGALLPLNEVRMDQVFSWFAEHQQGKQQVGGSRARQGEGRGHECMWRR